jgi:hypothetical protein
VSFSTKLLLVTLATVGGAIAVVRMQKKNKLRRNAKDADEPDPEERTGT